MQGRAASKIAGHRTKLFVFGLILSSALMWMFQLPVYADQSVTLNWNPSTAPDVASYKVYFGTTSLDYSNSVVVGNTNTATISGLAPGTIYYFAATTLDSDGNESDFSNEATYVTPAAPATLTSATRSGGQFSFTVEGLAGGTYVVQASTNLLDWVSVQTNTAPFVFTDNDAESFNQRFYRTFSSPP